MFAELVQNFSGEFFGGNSIVDKAVKLSYATDASVYQEEPVAVAIPKTVDDIKTLVNFAAKNGVTLIPRAAGTSLAGQVVGRGLVVDISKYFTAVLEVNKEEGWARVQPGVIRDDLNAYLKPLGLMFGPETSTASRAMIGGMIGNNSSGLHSIVWGDTRSNLLEINVVLSDGSEATFANIDKEMLAHKCKLPTLEGNIYASLVHLLSQQVNLSAIEQGFPRKTVHRRNTGYALDVLASQLQNEEDFFNLSQLVAGSEGTLCFITEAKLKLRPLPPSEKCVVAVHTKTINEALRANLIALANGCTASELVDDIILTYTETNIDQRKNRFFVHGHPRAILLVEFYDSSAASLDTKATVFIEQLKSQSLGYAFPVLTGTETDKAWDLRKAGLGLLRNEPGDTQPVNLIEDCAVDAVDLPDYINDVEALLKKYNVRYSMYAHAGAGELHVEPMVNLKTSAGKMLFRTILQETAHLVKKYRGSLSGEHGDGRLRGEFIPFMMGEKNYALFKEVKKVFDPNGIFNQGKIVDTPPMNEFLRYQQDKERKTLTTLFDFSKQEGILHLAEKCSGSGDCRKTEITGGTMCPSFMATRNEQDTTRARANMLRHFYTNKAYGSSIDVGEKEVLQVLDLCLSCKACKSECPSSVDVGKMKAEFMQAYYDRHGTPFRSWLVGNFTAQMKLAAVFPLAYNAVFRTPALRRLVNKAIGFHPARTVPLLHGTTLRSWWRKHQKKTKNENKQTAAVGDAASKQVYLFCDEFTNYHDVTIGQKAILLLEGLGYTVIMPEPIESGRTWLSKGLVKRAREVASKNVASLQDLICEATPVIGIEPSAILTLRDEYPDLVPAALKPAANKIAQHTFLFEEWFAKEIEKGNIKSEQFATVEKDIHIHGHCHQKTLSSAKHIHRSLAIVQGYRVHQIPSGCCGMAGSFGYEKEHYDVSMKIGGLVLFPAVKKIGDSGIVAASGTSCRHQIWDGTGQKSFHTIQLLYDALLKSDV